MEYNEDFSEKSNIFTQEEMYEEERNTLNNLRKDQSKDFLGVALSGGGLRSACFSIGVFRTIIDKHFFKHIDYLSGVSGGSYFLGSFLSHYMKLDVTKGLDIECHVLHNYKAKLGSEISLMKGDKVKISEINKDKWHLGTNLRTQKTGKFPEGYTDVVRILTNKLYISRENSKSISKRIGSSSILDELGGKSNMTSKKHKKKKKKKPRLPKKSSKSFFGNRGDEVISSIDKVFKEPAKIYEELKIDEFKSENLKESISLNQTKELFKKNIKFTTSGIGGGFLNILYVAIAGLHNFLFLLSCLLIIIYILYNKLASPLLIQSHFDVIDRGNSSGSLLHSFDINYYSKNRENFQICNFDFYNPYYYRFFGCYLGMYGIIDDISIINNQNISSTTIFPQIFTSYSSSWILLPLFWYILLSIIIIIPISAIFLFVWIHYCSGRPLFYNWENFKNFFIHFFCNCFNTISDTANHMGNQIKKKFSLRTGIPIEHINLNETSNNFTKMESSTSGGIKRLLNIISFYFILLIIGIFILEIFKICFYLIGFFYKLYEIDIFIWGCIIIFCLIIFFLLINLIIPIFSFLPSKTLWGGLSLIGLFFLFFLTFIAARIGFFLVYGIGFQFYIFYLGSEWLVIIIEELSFAIILIEILFSKFFHELIANLYRHRLLSSFFKNKEDIIITDLIKRPYFICNFTLNNYIPNQNSRNIPFYRKKKTFHPFFISPLFMGSQVTGFIKLPFRRFQIFLSKAISVSSAAISIAAGIYEELGYLTKFNKFLFFLLSINLGIWQVFPINYFRQKTYYYISTYLSTLLTQILPFGFIIICFWLVGFGYSYIIYYSIVVIIVICIIYSFIPTLLYIFHIKFPFKITITHDLFRRFEQVLGFNQTEKSNYIFLSDSGHFDLSGSIQLFKRKIKNILVFDSGDDNFKNDSLYTALNQLINEKVIEKEILLDDQQTVLNISKLMKKDNIIQITKKNFFKFSVRYCDDGSISNIWYAKATVTGNEKDMMIHLYSLMHKEFPQEAMSSFIFNEEQVDIYARLGEVICSNVLDDFLESNPKYKYQKKEQKKEQRQSSNQEKIVNEEKTEEIVKKNKRKRDEEEIQIIEKPEDKKINKDDSSKDFEMIELKEIEMEDNRTNSTTSFQDERFTDSYLK